MNFDRHDEVENFKQNVHNLDLEPFKNGLFSITRSMHLTMVFKVQIITLEPRSARTSQVKSSRYNLKIATL